MSAIRVDQNILNQRGTPAFFADNFSSRPAAGYQGRIFISADTHEIYRDDTTAWVLIADAGAGSGTLQSVTANGNTTSYGIDILSVGLRVQAGGITDYTIPSGGIMFGSPSYLLTTDTTNLFWDDTNNRLGLGTNAPGARLDVHATGTNATFNGTGTSNSTLVFQRSGTSRWTIGNYYSSAVADDFNIYDNVNSQYRFYVHNTGVINIPTSLIIGSSTPTSSYILDVTGNSNVTGTFRTTGAITGLSTANFSGTLTVDHTTAAAYGAIIYNRSATGQGLTIRGGSTSSQSALVVQPYDGSTTLLNILSTGAAVFSSSLTAGGDVNSTVGDLFVDATNKVVYIGRQSSTSGNGTNGIIIRDRLNATQASIDGNGIGYFKSTVGIGVTASSAIRLLVQGENTSSSNYAFVATNSTPANLFVVRNDKAIFAQGVYDFTSSGGTAVYVDSSGNLYRFTSSERYKREIIDYTNGLTELLKIQPKFYKSKNLKEGEKIFAGLIAEQIDEIGLNEFVEYNDEGQPDAVHYSAMTALLVKAIQEQNHNITSLQDRLDKLENK